VSAVATAWAWWRNPPPWDRTVRSSRQSQESTACLGLRDFVFVEPPRHWEAIFFQTFPASVIGSAPLRCGTGEAPGWTGDRSDEGPSAALHPFQHVHCATSPGARAESSRAAVSPRVIPYLMKGSLVTNRMAIVGRGRYAACAAASGPLGKLDVVAFEARTLHERETRSPRPVEGSRRGGPVVRGSAGRAIPFRHVASGHLLNPQESSPRVPGKVNDGASLWIRSPGINRSSLSWSTWKTGDSSAIRGHLRGEITAIPWP